MKKTLIFLIGIVFFSSIANGFAGFFTDDETPNIEILRDLNPHIIQGNTQLSSTVLVIKTKKGIELSIIKSSCPTAYKNLYENRASDSFDIYVVELSLLSGSCRDTNIGLQIDGNVRELTPAKITFYDTSKKFEQLLDNSTMELTYSVQNNISKIGEIDSTIEKLKQKNLAVSKLQIIEYAYEKQFLKYENSTMNNILYGRKNVSYLIPVANKSMPTNPSIIPNAGRPYRSDTTDGIHHGWDLMSPIGTPVRAMADGVVIRIVDNFSWSYFDQIKKGVGLSAFDKAKNLDIFRGNQVWLKMIDGNVVFYSHLSAIQDGLYVGKKIQSGDTLGKIGISGVPDKDYKNTHLHFEIAVNPLNSKNSPAIKDEIIMWPYLGKSLDKKQALSLQEKLFHGGFMAKK